MHFIYWSIILAFLFFILVVGRQMLFWRREGQKLLSNSGYIPPTPSRFATWCFRQFSRLVLFIFVGKTRVYGLDNLNFNGRKVICPNHQLLADPFLVAKHMPEAFRTIGTARLLRGPLAAIAAWVGGLTVPVEAGHASLSDARESFEVLSNIIASPYCHQLVIFPQGKLVFDNVQRPDDYRSGTVRSMRQAKKKLEAAAQSGVAVEKLPLALVPAGIVYDAIGRSAGVVRRIVRFAESRLLALFKVKSQPKFGAVLVFGKPIFYEDLNKNPRLATQQMMTEIGYCIAKADELLQSF